MYDKVHYLEPTLFYSDRTHSTSREDRYKKLYNDPNGRKYIHPIEYTDLDTGEVFTGDFVEWTKQNYIDAGIKFIHPMEAKEYLNEEQLEEMLNSEDYYAEEKLDGTRALMHIFNTGARIFSRRISKKSDWYTENTDSVPQLKRTTTNLKYTVIDGEMRIDGYEFKEVASTLNCDWFKAIERQNELGAFITLHAFDIIWYDGVYVAHLPLFRRKHLLEKVQVMLDNPHVILEPYTSKYKLLEVTPELEEAYKGYGFKEMYPTLYASLSVRREGNPFISVGKRTWFEYLMFHNKEGLMLKSIYGEYYHRRTRDFTKWKRCETWEVILVDFLSPTKEYEGKGLNDPTYVWEYWEDYEDESRIVLEKMTMEEAQDSGLRPVSKFYALDWVGNIQVGIPVPKNRYKEFEKIGECVNKCTPKGEFVKYLLVGECSGMTEEQREEFTKNRKKYLNTIIEVEGQEVFKDTGKIRNIRFLRIRPDADIKNITWERHIRKEDAE